MPVLFLKPLYRQLPPTFRRHAWIALPSDDDQYEPSGVNPPTEETSSALSSSFDGRNQPFTTAPLTVGA